jgi:hypothetical protein
MTSHRPGFLRRISTAFKRGILGKSSHDYTKQFTGNDEYWNRAIAAHLGWPRAPKPDPEAELRARP